MKNRKGFTLIELLAVIVILAILLAVAIPKITEYITNSRKDSFIDTAKEFADAVEKNLTSDQYDSPIASNDITLVSLNMIKLQKGSDKSPFNGKWLYDKSYVAIVNTGTDINPDYSYYIVLTDSKRYSLTLRLAKDIKSANIERFSSLNKLKMSITPICGDPDGNYMVINNIIGLESLKKNNTSWNATIYSQDGC